MKICLLFPNKQNYSETFIQYHKEYLQPEFTLTGGWRPYLTQNDQSIFNFPFSEPIRIVTKRVLSFLYPSFYNSYLKKYFLRTKPSVVLAEYGITASNVLKVCEELQLPLVVHFHGFDAFETKTINEYHALYKDVFQYARAIVAVSKDMAAQLISLGAEPSKVKLIPYGVLVDKFQGATPATSQQLVVAVGRFTAKKAPQLTIKAFQLVLKQCPEAKLLMIGKGELWDECQELIKSLRLDNSIELLGVKTPNEIAHYLQKARLFVQHSKFNPVNNDSEGTPNSILEASASGLPIVSTRHAGIKDAVDHETTGFLVEEGDYESMAQYMLMLLKDPALAGRMGRKAREKMIQEYNMPVQIEKLRNVLTQ